VVSRSPRRFGFLRLLTWAIHVHVAGLGNITAGSVHIHHYLWGILLLTVVAALGLIERTPAWHSWMGLLFGVGSALVVDEAALLIELRDVYWGRRGRRERRARGDPDRGGGERAGADPDARCRRGRRRRRGVKTATWARARTATWARTVPNQGTREPDDPPDQDFPLPAPKATKS